MPVSQQALICSIDKADLYSKCTHYPKKLYPLNTILLIFPLTFNQLVFEDQSTCLHLVQNSEIPLSTTTLNPTSLLFKMQPATPMEITNNSVQSTHGPQNLRFTK